jgi:uncharacterized paraquat-inducible protein A
MKLLKRFKKDESGIAYAAALAFATLIVIAISWSVLGPTLEVKIFGYAEEQVASGTYDYGPTAKMIHWVWAVWPLILLAATILYLFAASTRQQQGYYG